MGRDINVRIECKMRGKGNNLRWYDCTPQYRNPFYGCEDEPKYETLCDFGRNYEAFSLLQGEIGDLTSIGLPEDLSEPVKKEVEECMADEECAYGFGSFTLMELEYYCLKHPERITTDDEENIFNAEYLLRK